MAMNDVFLSSNRAAYSLIAMTMAMNKMPAAYRWLSWIEKNFPALFNPQPITTSRFEVEQRDGVLNLLSSQPLGAPAPKNTITRASLRDFRTATYLLEDVVRPEEIQGVRAFGTENQEETEANVLLRKMGTMRSKFDLTREWLRINAIKGIIVDGDNTTTLYNLFTEFGITRPTQSWALSTATTDMNGVVRSLVDYMEDNLKGDTMSDIGVVCHRTFYAKLINHPNVKAAYQYYAANPNQNLATDYRRSFNFAGVTFLPHGGVFTDVNGVARQVIETDTAYAFPVGGSQTFQEVFSPADFMETVNTPGLPFYAKTEPMPMNRGLNIHSQMNILPMCTRPELLVQITAT